MLRGCLPIHARRLHVAQHRGAANRSARVARVAGGRARNVAARGVEVVESVEVVARGAAQRAGRAAGVAAARAR